VGLGLGAAKGIEAEGVREYYNIKKNDQGMVLVMGFSIMYLVLYLRPSYMATTAVVNENMRICVIKRWN
jgi:hypothetical protein